MIAQPIINVQTRRNSESDDWRNVFSVDQKISVEYAAQYAELNRELGWTKYRFIY